MRMLFAFVAGALFGAGLYLSGMTDTAKVQGWLDLFGAWDPTLAFVMGGAMIPMAVAWLITRRRARPALATAWPDADNTRLDAPLVTGSVLFGAGWGLVGLCPGPVIASLGYGLPGVWIFLAAMLAGMAVAPQIKPRLDSGIPAE